MLPRMRPFLAVGLLLLALAGCAEALAQSSSRRQRVSAPEPPPRVELSSNTQTIIVCARDASQGPAQVQLTARPTNFSSNSLRYRWTTSQGRIVGTGPNTTWDLTGLEPGVYQASVEVDDGVDPICTAYSNTVVVIRPCPPLKPLCPNIVISCPETVNIGTPVTFTASISGGTPNITPVYNWTVSAGQIISGQGTPSIQVDTTGLAGQAITATVRVEGYELECSAVCTTQIPRERRSREFDRYADIARDDEKARLDNFAIELQNEPDAKGYIFFYSGRGRRARPGDAQARLNHARDYLINRRGIDPGRLVTLIGSPQETIRAELWIVPTGATPPRPK